jgi:uncharacterized C2H2 Zn-finger protein
MECFFNCQRCGFLTNRKDNFKRHLKRKNPCKAKKSNVSTSSLLQTFDCHKDITKLEPNISNDDTFICPHCSVVYKHRSSFNRHITSSQCRNIGKETADELDNILIKTDKIFQQPKLKLKEKEKLSKILDSDFYDEYLTLKFEQLKKQHSTTSDENIDALSNKIGLLEKTMIANSVPTLAELMSQKDNKHQIANNFNLYQTNENIFKKINKDKNKETVKENVMNKQSNEITYQTNNTLNNLKGNNAVGDNNSIDNRYQNSKIDNRYQNNQHNNITNNIYINDFGNENVNHISKKDWKKIIHKFYQAIPTLVEKIHIENKENQNVFIPSIKDNYALVYEKDDWQFKALTQVLEDIILTNADRLYDFISENEGEIDERTISKLDTIMEQLENGDTLYKKYQREVKYLLLNNRNLIKDHYEKHYLKPLKHR